jgi:RNA 2',3'-cyclic 3'-phosphodiesterase
MLEAVLMRLFVALDIDESIRENIARYLDGVREFAPDARWVRPESLHLTLKFIGEKSDEEVERIKSALGTIETGIVELTVRGYGFFPDARAPRVFWIGIEPDAKLTSLAATVDEKLAAINIPKETHIFNAHLTLARGAGGSASPRWRKADGPNRTFQRLQEKLSARPAPEFGTMTVREFYLYRSQTSPGGSRYTKLAEFPLH